jgi:hypothetical protein
MIATYEQGLPKFGQRTIFQQLPRRNLFKLREVLPPVLLRRMHTIEVL